MDELRVPPHNLEAEEGVLACCLIDSSVYDDIAINLSDDMFYVERHKLLWESMGKLLGDGKGLDEVNLLEQLKKDGNLDAVGGLSTIYSIQDRADTTLQAATWASIVASKWRLRATIRSCREAIEASYGQEGEPEDVTAQLEANIVSINKDAQEDSTIAKATKEVWAEIESMRDGTYVARGLKFGIPTIDEHLPHGMEPGTITVLSAPSSCGKSQLAINVAMRQAIQDGMSVGYCSYEMLSQQLARRMLRISSGIDLGRVADGVANRSELVALEETRVKLENCNILTDHLHYKVENLSSLARQWKRKHNIGLLVIDYLQLLESPNSKMSSVESVAHNSKCLKRLALDLGIPLMVLSQVNKEAEKRLVFNPDKGLIHQDLIGSSSIFQDADNIFMFWPKEGDADASRKIDQGGRPYMEMRGHFAKEREGTRGKRFDFKFIEKKGRFN
jgi:replicative DNA helicase